MTQFSGLSNVPLFSVTADKLITSFLRIPQANTSSVIENIVVVMDRSGTIPSSEFEKGKRALKNMMGIANFNGSDARYAAVTFSDSAMINFLFLPHDLAASEITKIPHPGGLTNTYIGLAVAKKLFQSLSSGTSSRQCNVALDGREQTKGLKRELTCRHSSKTQYVAITWYTHSQSYQSHHPRNQTLSSFVLPALYSGGV